MTETLTRAAIAEQMSRKLGFSQNESSNIIDVIIEEIASSVKEEEVLKLSGFGNFVLRKKKQRIGRNPKTGQEAVIEARNAIMFNPSQVLKKKINND